MNRSTKLITDLFGAFIEHPELLPPHFYRKTQEGHLWRTVSDYVAGMTDRYALIEYKRVIDPMTVDQ